VYAAQAVLFGKTPGVCRFFVYKNLFMIEKRQASSKRGFSYSFQARAANARQLGFFINPVHLSLKQYGCDATGLGYKFQYQSFLLFAPILSCSGA
jgi:hypothetical protein